MFALDRPEPDLEAPSLAPAVGAPAAWEAQARCNDGTGTLAGLFFSEDLDDIRAAKLFCGGCPVRAECLAGARERREPWGVWGGELFVNGRIVAHKRPRGRPRKHPRPEPELPAVVAGVLGRA